MSSVGYTFVMKWIGISGTWRQSSPELKEDVRREVQSLLTDSNAVVTGGALGVDYIATEIALEQYPDGSRIKVILPAPLERYAAHYRKRAEEGVITSEQAEQLIKQLKKVQGVGSLVTMDFGEMNQDTYYARNSEVVAASDELLAFQVNDSGGVQDTVDKAQERGIPVRVFRHSVE